jgi:hypothetical protein
VRVELALGQQPRALAHRLLVGGGAAGVAGVEGRDHSVEETPAIAGAAGPQSVEMRRQPDRHHVLAQRQLAGRVAAINANGPARSAALAVATGGSRRVEAGADDDASIRQLERRGDRPRRRRDSFARSRSTADLVQPGAAQTAAGGEKGDRLEQVGLARAVFAEQQDRRGIELQPQAAVVAELREPQLPYDHDTSNGRRHRRRSGCGRLGDGVDRAAVHTRIGMST